MLSLSQYGSLHLTSHMKLKHQIIFLSIVAIAGLSFVYYINEKSREEFLNAPKIRKEHKLEDLQVNRIKFDRGGLYLNGKEYNSGGISGYSKVHFEDSIISLDEVEPPFIMRKKENNDTLEFIKEDRKLYLLVSEELVWDTIK